MCVVAAAIGRSNFSRANILHIGNDYGQIDILLKSKYLDRKITSFIINEDKCIIAKNCYTTKVRKVNYIENLNNITVADKSILLLSNINDNSVLDNLDLTQFIQVVLLNSDIDITTDKLLIL